MAREHEEKIFLEAYDTHADAIFRYCYFKLSDREMAKDAAQEIFFRLWRYLVEGNRVQHMKTFLYTTASNYVKDQWKKKRSPALSSLISSDEDQPSFDVPDHSHEEIQQQAEYNRALRLFQKLGEDERLLLQLRFVEDLGVKDIAAILEERENTIAVRLSRALSRFRSAMHYNDE